MDDRRSAVSSFYGGRQSPMDALNNPPAQDYSRPDGRERRDSSSTFFGRNVEEYGNSLSSPRRGDAGYSSDSYRAQPGRVEPVKGLHDDEELGEAGGWNVFADFNNAGPRYSAAFGSEPKANSSGLAQPLSHWFRKLISRG
jgi:hypothetical protein